MDIDKILLEIHGKVASTETNVTNILSVQKEDRSAVKALHKRVDGHDKLVSRILGGCFVVLVGLKLFGIKVKTFFFGG